jgi:sugar phosphate isomerase/epimerase
MQIGTFARDNEQIEWALQHEPDFIDLRMDLNYRIAFEKAKESLNDAGVSCTLHLPSDPEWKPMNLASGIVPYIDLGAEINAELVSFHSTLSTLFYRDEDIDTFLEALPLASMAAKNSNVVIGVETLGLYYTELTLLFDEHPEMKMALDIGHGQIMATRNRALGHIESFLDHIEMVIVHDNNGQEMIHDILKAREKREVSIEETRELARRYDTHLPIGEGSIDFETIFRELKERGYDGKFLMMCADQKKFLREREKFMKLWMEA